MSAAVDNFRMDHRELQYRAGRADTNAPCQSRLVTPASQDSTCLLHMFITAMSGMLSLPSISFSR
mgnify:CR=1 FL=1